MAAGADESILGLPASRVKGSFQLAVSNWQLPIGLETNALVLVVP